jgi:hypothetical protein
LGPCRVAYHKRGILGTLSVKPMSELSKRIRSFLDQTPSTHVFDFLSLLLLLSSL